MLLTQAYFDESFDTGGQNLCFTIAGFIGGGEAFLSLDFAWKDFLLRNGISYFKAWECEWGLGEFSQFRDDPTDLSRPFSKRETDICTRIKTEAVDVIVAESEIYGIGTVLMLPDYKRVVDDLPDHPLPDPYNLCGQLTLVEAGKMVNGWNESLSIEAVNLVRPIFDSHEEHEGRFKAIFDSFASKNPISSKYLLPPYYEDDRSYRALQVADLLAYEARRLLVRTEYQPKYQSNKSWDRLLPRVRRIYKLDYNSLKIVALNRVADTIPIAATVDNSRAHRG